MENVEVGDLFALNHFFSPSDTAMNICYALHTYSGQAGVRGNAALPSVVEGFRLVAGLVRMALTALAVMW